MSFQASAFVLTINNYTEDDLRWVRTAVERDCGITYICFGLEVGDQGTPHIQGYLQLDTRKRASTVNRLLGNRARLERATGSLDDNKRYTSKTREQDETPNEIWEEYGVAREKRSPKRREESYESLMARLEAGADLKDLAREFPELVLKHLPNINKLRALFASDRTLTPFYGPFAWPTPAGFEPSSNWRKCLWFKGPSGIGKTQFACSLIDNPLFVRHIDQLKSFCPASHGGIIFDDMSFAHWPREAQITLLDCEMPTAIHVRYGIVELPAFAKRLFTSNVDIFSNDPAICRRYHRVNFN